MARGFSLLELLIAMSILVVLASVALPAYSNYQIRAQATEFSLAVSPYKTMLSEWALLHPGSKSWPSDGKNLGWQEHSGEHVRQVLYRRAADPAIVAIVVSGEIAGNSMQLFYQGHLQTGRVSWQCTAKADTLKFLPKSCTAAVAAGL